MESFAKNALPPPRCKRLLNQKLVINRSLLVGMFVRSFVHRADGWCFFADEAKEYAAAAATAQLLGFGFEKYQSNVIELRPGPG